MEESEKVAEREDEIMSKAERVMSSTKTSLCERITKKLALTGITQNNSPYQVERLSWVSIDNVLSYYVFQLDSAFIDERQCLGNIFQTMKLRFALSRIRLPQRKKNSQVTDTEHTQ